MVDNSMRRDRMNVQQGKPPSMSNGSLMRVSPVALLTFKGLSKHQILSFAEQDARMTHTAPEVIDATRVYVGMLVDLLQNKMSREEVVTEARDSAKTDLVRKIINLAITGANPRDGTPLSNGTMVAADSQTMGYFGIALHNAVYQLYHGRSFFRSLLDTIRLGGDTDTNACIAGALLGAYYGINSIPCQWVQAVNSVDLSNKLYKPTVQQQDASSLVLKFLRS